jgi:hypothetical protein
LGLTKKALISKVAPENQHNAIGGKMPKRTPATILLEITSIGTPFPSVPCTADNLRRVTAIGFSEVMHSAALLIEKDPNRTEIGDYEVIEISGELDFGDMTRKGVDAIRQILEAFLGCEFVKVPEDDADMWVYRRKDFQEKIDMYEAAQRFDDTIGKHI